MEPEDCFRKKVNKPRASLVFNGIWNIGLQIIGATFVARFLWSEFTAVTINVLPFFALTSGGLFLGMWKTSAALFAFLALFFTANAFTQAGILFLTAPLSTILCAIWLGSQLGSLFKLRSHAVSQWMDKTAFFANAFLTAIFAGFFVTYLKYPDPYSEQTALWRQAVFGYGDKNYFFTSAFIWWQGVTFFHLCRAHQSSLEKWVSPLFLIWGGSVGFFFCIQYFWQVPPPLLVGAYQPPATGFAYTSPLEDLSSFGSIAVTLYAALLFGSKNTSKVGIFGTSLASLSLVGLIALSFSRAAWLIATVVTVVFSFCRMSKQNAMRCTFVLVLVVVSINLFAPFDEWKRSSYLYRLGTLVRFEGPTAKLSSRMFMFDKAINMLRAKPIFGFGLGTFYIQSVNFAAPGDPLANTPDFAHNVFLQLATEIGIPGTGFLFALMAISVFPRNMTLGTREPQTDRSAHNKRWLATSLLAYMATQMTANSLNVYISNQILFWFLLAALLPLRKREVII